MLPTTSYITKSTTLPFTPSTLCGGSTVDTTRYNIARAVTPNYMNIGKTPCRGIGVTANEDVIIISLRLNVADDVMHGEVGDRDAIGRDSSRSSVDYSDGKRVRACFLSNDIFFRSFPDEGSQLTIVALDVNLVRHCQNWSASCLNTTSAAHQEPTP